MPFRLSLRPSIANKTVSCEAINKLEETPVLRSHTLVGYNAISSSLVSRAPVLIVRAYVANTAGQARRRMRPL
jgi:hypothetical protein